MQYLEKDYLYLYMNLSELGLERGREKEEGGEREGEGTVRQKVLTRKGSDQVKIPQVKFKVNHPLIERFNQPGHCGCTVYAWHVSL